MVAATRHQLRSYAKCCKVTVRHNGFRQNVARFPATAMVRFSTTPNLLLSAPRPGALSVSLCRLPVVWCKIPRCNIMVVCGTIVAYQLPTGTARWRGNKEIGCAASYSGKNGNG